VTSDKRFPVLATLLVAAAVIAMLALGVWQLQRRAQKNALIADYSANLAKPPVAFPRFPVGQDDLLFRKSSLFCIEASGWEKQAGRSADGTSGWLFRTRCRTGAEGPGVEVALGVGSDPNAVPQWKGGEVTGIITHAPDHRPLIASLFGKGTPQELMLVADRAPPGLAPSARPDPAGVPNNHLAYAVQWFAFAGVALVIYGIALRRRLRADPA
jgi:surfeit locus 1 family protein